VHKIIEKRLNLHKNLLAQQQESALLHSQIARLQALANIGTAASMIAHEMNNILTPLTTYAQLALNNPDDKPLTQKALQKTALNAARAAKILESILSMVNGEQLEKKSSRLTLMIDEIFTCLCRDLKKDKIIVQNSVPVEFTIWAIPVQFQQVLMNLILNARDAMLSGGGTLVISASETPAESIVEISDTGSGISPDNLSRIFEPFFTTKTASSSVHRGAGLGLAFCRQIVDAHSGRITVTSQLQCGTTFKIVLPKP
jgi:signal transduction histidine kinase